jgi:hypothetical protein
VVQFSSSGALGTPVHIPQPHNASLQHLTSISLTSGRALISLRVLLSFLRHSRPKPTLSVHTRLAGSPIHGRIFISFFCNPRYEPCSVDSSKRAAIAIGHYVVSLTSFFSLAQVPGRSCRDASLASQAARNDEMAARLERFHERLRSR